MNGPLISDIAPETTDTSLWFFLLVALAIYGLYRIWSALGDEDLWRLAKGILMVAAVVLVVWADIATSLSGAFLSEPEKVAVKNLDEAYGITILSGTPPTRPSGYANSDILVGGVVQPCTIATTSTRYAISCEDDGSTIVLEPVTS